MSKKPARRQAQPSTPRGATGSALPADAVSARVAHRASGAAGVHADQRTRRSGTFRTNRVGSRSSQRRAAVADAR